VVEVELNRDNVLQQITDVLNSATDPTSKVRRIAEAIRLAGHYRWVGIYDVDEREIAIIAWSGTGAPAYPRFPVTQGLSGHAVSSRSSIVSNDVAHDPRYLTAFGSTQSEIIVPIIDPESHRVVGTLDVESEHKGAFTEAACEQLEEYARRITGLWR
jgi:L-methionine (R)-S-oxide reductase